MKEIVSRAGFFAYFFACRPYFWDKYGTALAGLKGKVQGCTL
jgi:hypothetical protein